MKCDKTLKSAIRYKYIRTPMLLFHDCRVCAYKLSTPLILDRFPQMIKGFPREEIAVVLACSILCRIDSTKKYVEWAKDVLSVFPDTPSDYNIEDNLDPCRINEYAKQWIEVNSISD